MNLASDNSLLTIPCSCTWEHEKSSTWRIWFSVSLNVLSINPPHLLGKLTLRKLAAAISEWTLENVEHKALIHSFFLSERTGGSEAGKFMPWFLDLIALFLVCKIQGPVSETFPGEEWVEIKGLHCEYHVFMRGVENLVGMGLGLLRFWQRLCLSGHRNWWPVVRVNVGSSWAWELWLHRMMWASGCVSFTNVIWRNVKSSRLCL